MNCPDCGSKAVYQHWWHRADGAGGTVPVCPSTEDERWNCTACGCEFTAEVDPVVPVEAPDYVRFLADWPWDDTPAFEIVRADTGGGKTDMWALFRERAGPFMRYKKNEPDC